MHAKFAAAYTKRGGNMNINSNPMQFNAIMIVAGAMVVNRKTELTFNEIEKYISSLNKKIKQDGYSCVILCDKADFEDLQNRYNNLFFVDQNGVTLNKEFGLKCLVRNVLSYCSLNMVNYLFDKSKNNDLTL